MTLAGTKDTTCFVCGPDNPLGLQVPFEPDREAGSSAMYIARKEHRGWNGILYGRITFSPMDEAFGWCLYFQRIPAVTARIETQLPPTHSHRNPPAPQSAIRRQQNSVEAS